MLFNDRLRFCNDCRVIFSLVCVDVLARFVFFLRNPVHRVFQMLLIREHLRQHLRLELVDVFELLQFLLVVHQLLKD